MNYYFLKRFMVFFVLFAILSCDNSAVKRDKVKSAIIPGDNPTAKSDSAALEKLPSQNTDSISLTTLIRQVYHWREKTIKNNMFKPKTINLSDTLYSGIDWTFHNNLVKSLQESNYFDKTFIDNFHNIALGIDKELRKGKTPWYVGDLPPFGYEADPWCNCQDNPDNYWDKIILTSLIIDKNAATFKWTWGDDFFYKAKASLNNGTWRINYLEGFEPKLYTWKN